MKNEIFSILIIGVLLVGFAAIVPIYILPEVEALKSKGTSNSEYGSATRDKVCGDRLCSEIPKEPSNSIKEENQNDNDKPKRPPVDKMCTLEHAPVCGTDDITYSNMCHLEAAQIELAYNGECKQNDGSAKTIPHPEKMTSAIPIPDNAKGPQIDFSKGYLVEEIKDGLYWITDGAYQTMFLTLVKE